MKLITVPLILMLLGTGCHNDEPGIDQEQLSVQEITSPAGDSCAEPFLFSDKHGTVYLSWVEKSGDSASLKYARFDGRRWTPASIIASGKNWFVNWADYPMVSSADGRNMAAHYLEKSGPGKFAYDIKFSSSADSGISWTGPVTLHDDSIEAEHGFVSLMPFGDYFFASWLDGRNTVNPTSHGEHKKDDHSMAHGGPMSLRAAVMNGDQKMEEWELDNRVCDCCQTAVVQTANGPVVVYRDRSEQNIRDIAIVRYVKGEWQKPFLIFADNWQIDGCPVNGPRIDAIDNNLVIAWFTMAGNQPEVKVVFSENGGAEFTKPVRIDEGKTIGRVDVVMLDASSAIVSWMEGGAIRSRKVFADGRKGKVIAVGMSASSRSAGFPQITKSGNDLYYAWTDGDSKRIKTVMIANAVSTAAQ
ncbi:MAG: exo-alpha-sialidase [Sphingobacteriales bacterium]|nr:MAG: exo-alpha-sialidase [Sphingobacteriales bacterium]